MDDKPFTVNGREYSILALSFRQEGTFYLSTWNADTEVWEPDGTISLPNRYVINLPVSVTLTELVHFDGDYEAAYQGIDHLPDVFSGTETAGIKWWQELLVTHNTSTDWINHHSGDLT